MSARGEIRVVQDAAALARAAAELVIARAGEARHPFTLVLAGGSTPRALYTLLASDPVLRERMPWGKTHFFWGDERHVPPDHPESNYRMAHAAMLAHVPVPSANIHRIGAELADAREAARDYEREIRTYFQLGPDEFPRFDLVLLGMGDDGHTASLFPGTPALGETGRLVVANRVDRLDTERITLTPPVLSHAAAVVFVVQGADKAETLQAVLEGPDRPRERPAQLVRLERGSLTWLIDQAAASMLDR